jgi:hypothetical protein
MAFWKTAPVSEEPEITLYDWKVFELNDGSRHFVGTNGARGSGRVSSSIQTFDPTTMSGVTRSGRVYKLVGESGDSINGLYTWTGWCHVNRVDDCIDVSNFIGETK